MLLISINNITKGTSVEPLALLGFLLITKIFIVLTASLVRRKRFALQKSLHLDYLGTNYRFCRGWEDG